MRFDVKRGLLPDFLILTILFVASSLFFTGDKMEKLTYAREPKIVSSCHCKTKEQPTYPLSKTSERTNF
nr:hypothetical protein CFP56_04665 [Quercus suber]